MKLAEFKKHFYSYISKKDYITAITAILGSLTTTFVTGYSSYLSDRNDRIRRLNKTPINRIMVDFITYEEYERRINPDNWKPSSQRPIEEDTSYKNEGFSGYLKHWLSTQNTKKHSNNYEINAEDLQALMAENTEYNELQNNTKMTNTKETENNINNKLSDHNETKLDKKKKKKAQTRFEKSISKIGELSNSTNNGNLPPSIKKIEKVKYFVVRDGADGITNDPLKLRLQKGKQNIELQKSMKQSIGTIGGQEIKKDDSIFSTMGYIFKKILRLTDKPQYQVIDSRYDQYGNRIQDAEYLKRKKRTKEKMAKLNQEKRKKKEAKTTKAIGNNEQNIEQNSSQNNEIEEHSDNNDSNKKIEFIIPIFKIDGNLQNMSSYQTLQSISTSRNLGVHEKKTMAFLEYQFERCLYQTLKNYVDKNFTITIQLEYNDNAELQKIKILQKRTNDMPTDFASYQNEIINNLKKCNIINNNYISENNYSIWGVIKLKISPPTNNL